MTRDGKKYLNKSIMNFRQFFHKFNPTPMKIEKL